MSAADEFARALVPLWQTMRGPRTVDALALGAFAACRADGTILASAGNPELSACLRSSAKPFQVLAFLRRGLDQKLGLGHEDIACACASHSGERWHVESARRILGASGCEEHELLCGTHEAVAPELKASVARGETEITAIHNNCSGKHSAMLACCVHEAWPKATYTEPDHPLQVENRATLASFAGISPESIVVARDNCTVPSFALPLRLAATAIARWRTPSELPEELGDAAELAARAMLTHPLMVGGTDRLDTDIMATTEGRLLVKTGANGYYIAAGPNEAGQGLGLALKLSAAEGEVGKSKVVVALLRQLEMLSEPEAQRLRDQHAKPQLSCRGHDVGESSFIREAIHWTDRTD